MKFLAVLCIKNEGAFLLEWLAHHRAVGFTDFLVFSNDCDDGSREMLDHLQSLDWLTHERNDGPYHARGVQFTALKQAQRHPLVKAADWILPLDVDEFVNVKCGNHQLADLLRALPEATAITLTWRLFGNAGQRHFVDAPVTETFTRCAPDPIQWPWRAAMFKTLYRNDGTYRALGVHRPRRPDAQRLAQARWFDGEGRELHEDFRTARIFSNFLQSNCGLVQLNHYPLGAIESYLLKVARGRAVHAEDRLGMDYWVERNFNQIEDRSILALSEKMHHWRNMLLSDSRLKALHENAVAWRHRRFRALMHQDRFRALYGRLMMTPETRALSVQEARFMLEFAQAAADSGST